MGGVPPTKPLEKLEKGPQATIRQLMNLYSLVIGFIVLILLAVSVSRLGKVHTRC